jgi:hypothetical protein
MWTPLLAARSDSGLPVVQMDACRDDDGARDGDPPGHEMSSGLGTPGREKGRMTSFVGQPIRRVPPVISDDGLAGYEDVSWTPRFWRRALFGATLKELRPTRALATRQLR